MVFIAKALTALSSVVETNLPAVSKGVVIGCVTSCVLEGGGHFPVLAQTHRKHFTLFPSLYSISSRPFVGGNVRAIGACGTLR